MTHNLGGPLSLGPVVRSFTEHQLTPQVLNLVARPANWRTYRLSVTARRAASAAESCGRRCRYSAVGETRREVFGSDDSGSTGAPPRAIAAPLEFKLSWTNKVSR